jgi:thiosulfate/3-mercaptopyruvate sulfurtransferase
MKPILNPEELVELMKLPDTVIVDAGESIDYTMQHIKGAVRADINTDLAAVPDDAANGGRHPLPDPKAFGQVLGRLGIRPQSHVVVYDNKGGALAAARFWWMLKAAGHEKVQVLNGGLGAAVKAGFMLSDLAEMPIPAPEYVFNDWYLPLAFMDEVEAAALNDNSIVIDVRDIARYNGETETIDIVAGHIPGAINIPYVTNLDADGLFLPPEELAEKYAAFIGNANDAVIVHCGSGVTACHTLLALNYAGFAMPKLYVGSWSEWSRNNKNIATGIA